MPLALPTAQSAALLDLVLLTYGQSGQHVTL